MKVSQNYFFWGGVASFLHCAKSGVRIFCYSGGGVLPPSSVHSDNNDNDTDNDGMVTPIKSRFAGRYVGDARLKNTYRRSFRNIWWRMLTVDARTRPTPPHHS